MNTDLTTKIPLKEHIKNIKKNNAYYYRYG